MVRTSGSKTSFRFLRLLLSVYMVYSAPHSLSYNFTISPNPRPGQPWCVVQCQVDKEYFLSYDCGAAKIQSMSLLGEKVKGTKDWEGQMETLRDAGNVLKEQLPDIVPEEHTLRDLLTLQGMMTCHKKANGDRGASWYFGFHGQMSLTFDPENETLTLVHPEGRRMKEKWEHNRDVTKFFRKTSMGDCRAWLDRFLEHWKEILKTTASPTTATHTTRSRAIAVMPTACLLFVVFTYGVFTYGILC
ncbi:UL16-binding protein 1 [Camelus dromedarius]|uniref:UL16-binding protein 1-like n=6 Tax=Camelus TaxID=9836 RepID=A0A8B6YG25_CAMFR|nr:UL16-binding protein 1-like [Camelus ferus]XP_010992302.2 UL16-binding protein 1-like [Camelus dromedarius]XP_010992303.2 UL16-binding protein 1-like [Camelus dromedarius]XP_014415431.2 UL16-binding protein 1-like [Camelus ferus]XP_032341044.1 UL16-binding protein 1-like [Camelus ferus]